MNAELEGVICSGPMRGAQQTYALARRAGSPAGADESGDAGRAGAPILRRPRTGKRPDLARWSSLTLDASAGPRWKRSQTGWTAQTVDGSRAVVRPGRAGTGGRRPGALLLPLYDELTLSYPVINFPRANGHPHTPGEDLFVGCVIIAETNVGTWRRTVKGRKLIVEVALAPGVAAVQRRRSWRRLPTSWRHSWKRSWSLRSPADDKVTCNRARRRS